MLHSMPVEGPPIFCETASVLRTRKWREPGFRSGSAVPYSVPSTCVQRAQDSCRNAQNPRNWRREDPEVVARRFQVDVDSQKGTSHVTFRHPEAGRTTVPKHIPIKPWYVRDFVRFIGKLEDSENE